MKKLQSEISRVFNEVREQKTKAAVHAVSSEILSLSATYVPVDSSVLINSKIGPEIETKGDITKGTIGYTAEYAAAVHEMSGKLKGQPRANFGVTRKGKAFGGGTGKGNYWDPNAKPKFLEEAGKEMEPQIENILEGIYRV